MWTSGNYRPDCSAEQLCVSVPYGFGTADDCFHHVIPDLLPVILMNVEGEDDLTHAGLPVLPVLTHHVLQVDGR